ncbi:glycosyltransferase family 2 protein [Oceanicoccus sagamiensis]|uniref:Glycosyltransferase 2-like domain-containing protein n=1 Tax=Oceanicoccus sagamiensis TaxID=716816 RepID=A0A1X9N7B2_9GAMM|nr:glycosyltransferase family 2 protein [Oceanicoccus sagamiensis]ARN73024.1 hypothetical protein BST96_02220 [Oceanicoccus sagamiensis]
MNLTLIMCTLGRTEEPKRLLDSLVIQTHKDFKLIIVDQNTDGRLDKLVADYSSSLPITHLQSSPGLSKARNAGLSYANEGIIAFPDDDCWYSPTLIEQVSNFFTKEPDYNGLSINRAASEKSCPKITPEQELSKFTIWGKVPSICLFLRYSATLEIGKFDEQLGVGSGTLWGAGEDSDYVLRSLHKGHRWKRAPSITVYHADNIQRTDVKGKARVRSYSRGLGRVLSKHKMPLWSVIGSLILSLLRILKALLLIDFQGYRWQTQALLGKIEGLLSKEKQTIDSQNHH